MYSLTDTASLDPLLKDINDRRVVMLGEASHGTHEYYTWRTAISKRLIVEKNFRFIAVEGDWPDCYLINRYVKGYADGGTDIRAVMGSFDRWPTWMWANREVLQFITWLHEHNRSLPDEDKTGFYGLDLNSMHASMAAVINYLDKMDPDAAKSARERYACLDHFGVNPQSYAYGLSYGGLQACEEEVIMTVPS